MPDTRRRLVSRSAELTNFLQDDRVLDEARRHKFDSEARKSCHLDGREQDRRLYLESKNEEQMSYRWETRAPVEVHWPKWLLILIKSCHVSPHAYAQCDKESLV